MNNITIFTLPETILQINNPNLSLMKKILLTLTIAMFAFCSVSIGQSVDRQANMQKKITQVSKKLDLNDVQAQQFQKIMVENNYDLKNNKKAIKTSLANVLTHEQMQKLKAMIQEQRAKKLEKSKK
jgi:septal ring factor EnvC (AmiA/AmiB activator)